LKPILVVDDDAEVREMIAAVLTAASYAVREAPDGRSALDVLLAPDQSEQPCLLVVDIVMPEMSGWEFIAVIKSYYRLSLIPVIVVSGRERPSEAARQHVIADYFTKPLDTPAFLARVEELTSSRG
jgi:CheY-like chemotaxis protein